MHNTQKSLCALTLFFVAAFAASARDLMPFEKLTAKAEKGDAYAQFELGKLYQEGDGVPQDDAQAEKWLTKSAEQNDVDAQFYLGLVYRLRGVNHVAKYNIIAYMWFDIAAANDDDRASGLRSDVAEFLTYEQIEEAKQKSEEWRAKHPTS